MFQAIRENTIVKVIYATQGMIIIPDTANKFKKYDGALKYEVISVGPRSRWKDDIKPGDNIIIQRHEGKPFIWEGEQYLTVRDRWVMGKGGE